MSGRQAKRGRRILSRMVVAAISEVGRVQAHERATGARVTFGLTEASRQVARANRLPERWAVQRIRASAREIGRRVGTSRGARATSALELERPADLATGLAFALGTEAELP